MLLRHLSVIALMLIFLQLTSAERPHSWEPALSSFERKTHGQTKNAMKLGNSKHTSNHGGDSMSRPASGAHENIKHAHGKRKAKNNNIEDASLNSGSYVPPYDEDFSSWNDKYNERELAANHHKSRHHHFKNNLHDNIESGFHDSFTLHRDRMRREESITHKPSTVSNHTSENITNPLPAGEHKLNISGLQLNCVKTNHTSVSYKIINAASPNVTTNTTVPGSSAHPNAHEGNSTISPTDQNENAHNSGGVPGSNGTDKAKELKHGAFNSPCNIFGQWISEAGGVQLDIKAGKSNGQMDVQIHESNPHKKGFLSPEWKISGNLPFSENGKDDIQSGTVHKGPIVLTGTAVTDSSDKSEEKVAVFLGECRVCYEGVESVLGSWSVRRLSKDCIDAALSHQEITDVFHRDVNTGGAEDKSKSEGNIAITYKDKSEHNRMKHSHKRQWHSYND